MPHGSPRLPKQLPNLIRRGLHASTTKWLLLGSIVGLATGIAGFVFYLATELGSHLIIAGLIGYQEVHPAGELRVQSPSTPAEHEAEHPNGMLLWLLPVVLLIGGLLSGLVAKLAPSVQGAGTEAAIRSFHRRHGHIPLRTAVAKFVATCCTYCTGGSAGREGPIGLIGAALGSVFGGRMKLSNRDRRILLLAGMAGGIAALFRAPLAGAFFAAEVLYRDPDVESEALIPAFLSAIVSYCCFGVLFTIAFPNVATDGGFLAPLFATPDLAFNIRDGWSTVTELLAYLCVALVVVVGSRFFASTYQHGSQLFNKIPGPSWLHAGIGGLLTGTIAIAVLYLCWQTGLQSQGRSDALAMLSAGYGIIQQALTDPGSITASDWPSSIVVLLLVIAVGKILTTTCTVGSGGSGGLFGPSVVIGGCLGGALGFGLQSVPALATYSPPPAACIIMGMAGFLAASYRTPVAALLMIAEMTGSYSLLLPGMWVCALSYQFAGRHSLVGGQVRSPMESPAHRGHFFSDILAGIHVDLVFDPKRVIRTLKPASSIDACKQLVTESNQTVYPVVDEEGVLCGIFSLNDLRSFLYDETLGLVAVAQDVATTDIISLSREDSLAVALRRFTVRNLEELPVIDDKGVFLGLLSRRQAIAYYNEVLDELREQRREDGYDADGDEESGDDINSTRHHRS